MKKKILMFVLAFCFIVPCLFLFSACNRNTGATEPNDSQIRAIYVLAQENGYTGTYEEWLASIKGEKGATGDNVELRVSGGYIQWKTTSDTTWQNLISIESLKGSKGNDGTTPTIEISNDGYWVINGNKSSVKAQGESGITPTISISDDGYWVINGEKTNAKAIGQDATYNNYTITYDYGAAKEYFENNIDDTSIKSTEWITDLPTIKDLYKESFLGWFIEGTNKKIENYDFIGGNITLCAKFNTNNKTILSGVYENGKYTATWDDLKSEYSNYITDSEILCKHNPTGETCTSAFTFAENSFLVVDDSIINIEDSAFKKCSNLCGVKLSSSVLKIGTAAFWNCENLESFYLGNGETEIGYDAFKNCSDSIFTIINGTKYINFNGNDKYYLYDVDNASIRDKLEEIIDSVVVICDVAFSDCLHLDSLIIPNTVKHIGAYAFDHCAFLTTIKIPTSVLSIGNGAFVSCASLTTLIIEPGVVNIGKGQFDDFTNSGVQIYFVGSEDQWTNINIENQYQRTDDWTNVKYFSELQPDANHSNYWHYDTDGITPIIWEVK